MKAYRDQITMYTKKMYWLTTRSIHLAVVLFLLFFSSCSSTTSIAQTVDVGVNITPPFWAPTYENVDRIHYYYLPDIECYYDVWNQEFVYLDDGNWMFASQLPSFYSWYNFNADPFVVVLDWHVHEPWMHHHFYVAHYPRYYYRSVYKDNVRTPSGFNENIKTVVYNRSTIANKTIEQKREPVSNEAKVKETRPSQKMNYYGNTVGSPVHVQKNMMRPRITGTENRGRAR